MTTKTALAVLALAGLASAATPAAAQQFGLGFGPHGGISFSYDSGGYCDQFGCPDDFWDMPVYYGPVFYEGQWFDGPAYYRDGPRGREYWVRGGWHHDQWRGPRPGWWREGRYGPALGMDYYRQHNFHGRWDGGPGRNFGPDRDRNFGPRGDDHGQNFRPGDYDRGGNFGPGDRGPGFGPRGDDRGDGQGRNFGPGGPSRDRFNGPQNNGPNNQPGPQGHPQPAPPANNAGPNSAPQGFNPWQGHGHRDAPPAAAPAAPAPAAPAPSGPPAGNGDRGGHRGPPQQ